MRVEPSNCTQCELCKTPARLFCAADEANLCWECDAQVHGANFLVARHVRSMLCAACGAPTEWMKSGIRVDSEVLFCRNCYHETSRRRDSGRDEAGMTMASSESRVVLHSRFRCGVTEGCLKTRGDKETPRTEFMGTNGVACGRKSRRKWHSLANASNSRRNSQRAQSSIFVDQPDVGDVKRPTELCCKDWSVTLISCVDTEDESSCESNVPQVLTKVSYLAQSPTRKRIRNQVESGLDTATSHASGNAGKKNVVTEEARTKKVKVRSMQRRATACCDLSSE